MGDADGKMNLEVLELLEHFKGRLGSDTPEPITFLKDHQTKSVCDSVKKLLGHFSRAEKKYRDAVADYNEAKKKKPDDEEPRKPNLSDYLIWNEVHEQGHKLWKDLMRAAIVAIDPNAKGHSELLNYLDAATQFEDLLYGLEEFYRDHTLHSLWVYLIGVMMMKEDPGLKRIADKLNWYVCNDVRDKEHPESVVEWARLEEDRLNDEVQKDKDAIWCVMALCHDLGYSLAKLKKLNEKVQAVLKYYDVSDFRHVGYTLDLEHQYLVAQCLDLMAMDVRITPGDDYPDTVEDKVETELASCIKGMREVGKENDESCEEPKHLQRNTLRSELMKAVSVASKGDAKGEEGMAPPAAGKLEALALKVYDNVLTKCFRDDASYWRLCKALEQKQHGVVSAYLLYKTIGLFADTSVRPPAEGWGLEDDEAVDNIIRGDILFGIAQHEFAFAHIDQMSSLAEILILCDELEEFTRLGRQHMSRKYHDTTAETSIEVKTVPRGETDPRKTKVEILMTYDSRHEKREEFVKFCWRKAGRLCKLFSLVPDERERTTNEDKAYRISQIKATFNYDDEPRLDGTEQTDGDVDPDERVVFSMWDDTDDRVKRAVEITLPIMSNGKKEDDPVELECQDDDIYVAGSTDEDPRLVKWLWDQFGCLLAELPSREK